MQQPTVDVHLPPRSHLEHRSPVFHLSERDVPSSFPPSSGRSASHQEMPPSVNFHLWEPCNMRCRFCFATFQDVRTTVLPRGHLPREHALRVVERLARFFRKVSFAGGEPTLCPWLPELVRTAKAHGMVTMLVTNGSRLRAESLAELKGQLDWVALSIDSANPETHAALGRAVHGKAHAREDYLRVAGLIRDAGMRQSSK